MPNPNKVIVNDLLVKSKQPNYLATRLEKQAAAGLRLPKSLHPEAAALAQRHGLEQVVQEFCGDGGIDGLARGHERVHLVHALDVASREALACFRLQLLALARPAPQRALHTPHRQLQHLGVLQLGLHLGARQQQPQLLKALVDPRAPLLLHQGLPGLAVPPSLPAVLILPARTVPAGRRGRSHDPHRPERGERD